MEFLLLLLCSVIIARFLEKRFKIATIAHAVLFVVIFCFYILGSDLEILVKAGINTFGEEDYSNIHGAIADNVEVLSISFSSLLVVEAFTFGVASLIAIRTAIKGLKKLIKQLEIKIIVFKKKIISNQVFSHKTNSELTYKNNYLVFSRLLN